MGSEAGGSRSGRLAGYAAREHAAEAGETRTRVVIVVRRGRGLIRKAAWEGRWRGKVGDTAFPAGRDCAPGAGVRYDFEFADRLREILAGENASA